MDALSMQRKDVEEELRKLIIEEERIDAELEQYLAAIKRQPNGQSSSSFSNYYEISSVGTELKKVENVAPMLESLSQNAKKLVGQVDDCRSLSDRLSNIVRQLDTKQMRAQKALSCTEDILGLRECRHKITSALENDDLPTAVKYLKQVHEIDIRILEISEDYQPILAKEKDIKSKVQTAFQAAIESSNIDQVMLYCPLLQFFRLQHEARENLLRFFNEKIFITLDSEHVLANTHATDAATAYIQGLVHIFNTSYIIIQTYLPIVLQGLEECYGDIHFIQNLHHKVETEASVLLKKFIKFRNLNDMVAGLSKGSVQVSELHASMDELALIVQYCCKYLKYLKHICHGAETRVRPHTSTPAPSASTSATVAPPPGAVFSGPLELERMVDELVHKYYLVGEAYLVRAAGQAGGTGGQLDVCYFLLQKCGLRAAASHHLVACVSVAQGICQVISQEVCSSLQQQSAHTVHKISTLLQDYYAKYKKALVEANSSHTSSTTTSLSRGFFSLMAAPPLSSSAAALSSVSGGGTSTPTSGAYPGSGEMDVQGAAQGLEVFNRLELCVTFTDRLSKELLLAGENVFVSAGSEAGGGHAGAATAGGLHRPGHGGPAGGSSSATGVTGASAASGMSKHRERDGSAFHIATDADKLRAVKEQFDQAKQAFIGVMRQAADKIVSSTQSVYKDLFTLTSDPFLSTVYVQYNLPDTRFDSQPNLAVLPKLFVVPIENMLYMLSGPLSDQSKDLMLSLAAEVCCDKLEIVIKQTTFSYSGALKMEETVRSLHSLFARYAGPSVRLKFTRLKETMQVLTSPSLGDSLNDNYTVLTASEIEALFALRVEG